MNPSYLVALLITVAHPQLPPLALPATYLRTADDDIVQYDPKDAIKRQQFQSLDIATDACFDRSIRALLFQGIRSRAQLLQFAENVCGRQLKLFMISLGVSDALATEYIRKGAEDALDAILAR